MSSLASTCAQAMLKRSSTLTRPMSWPGTGRAKPFGRSGRRDRHLLLRSWFCREKRSTRLMADHPRAQDATELIRAWQQGDPDALNRVVPLVYDELRRVAHAHFRAERAGHLLQTTALVHEAYLRLVDLDRINLRNRAHLLALAARLMRQILVDQA